MWQDCPEERDKIVIRDGSRVEDPILLIYCGGPLPRITARGPAMLVEFRSSHMAIPIGASSLRLELETQVTKIVLILSFPRLSDLYLHRMLLLKSSNLRVNNQLISSKLLILKLKLAVVINLVYPSSL